VYLSEHVDGEFATVRSKIVTGAARRSGGLPSPQVGARWLVYDVAVSGVVASSRTYRGQFDKIIRSSSYAALMRDLKVKFGR